MKCVIAPDSYKNCMRSERVCEIIGQAILDCDASAEVLKIPMADGGEGTIDAILATTAGEEQTVSVLGPLGTPVQAKYGVINVGTTAIMEMAEASGLELIDIDQRNPLITTTYGTGEMIRHALDQGIRDIIIGIGGSATVDGGAGMGQALGYKLLDNNGSQIPRGGGALRDIATVTTDQADPRLAQCMVRVACDVTNPLLGEKGAAAVFGPQKGATPQMIPVLEQGLSTMFQACATAQCYIGPADGDGAAGGLGAGLRAFCNATIISGAQLVAETVSLDTHLNNADFLITGEGKTDEQTLHGKLCAVVADIAKTKGVKTIVVSGAVTGDQVALEQAFDYIAAITPEGMDLDTALATAPENLYTTTKEIIASLLHH